MLSSIWTVISPSRLSSRAFRDNSQATMLSSPTFTTKSSTLIKHNADIHILWSNTIISLKTTQVVETHLALQQAWTLALQTNRKHVLAVYRKTIGHLLVAVHLLHRLLPPLHVLPQSYLPTRLLPIRIPRPLQHLLLRRHLTLHLKLDLTR